MLIKFRNTVYRQALTPSQKEKKKDYLFQQYKKDNTIPSWSDVWEWVQGTDGYRHEFEHLLDTQADYFLRDLDMEALIDEQLSEEDINDEEARREAQEDIEFKPEPYIEPLIQEALEPEYEARYDNIVTQLEYEIDGEDVWRVIDIRDEVDPTKLSGLGEFWGFAPKPSKLAEIGCNEEFCIKSAGGVQDGEDPSAILARRRS